MSESKKGSGEDSFGDSESIFVSDTFNLREVPSISARRIEYIIRRAFYYSHSPFSLLGPDGAWYYASMSSDYDGWPLTDMWKLHRMPSGAEPYGSAPFFWIAGISYDSWGTDKGKPDYETKATPARGFGGMHAPDLAKFYFNGRYFVTCHTATNGGADTVAADLIALESQLKAWDKNTETLDAWAKSGMDMLGRCEASMLGFGYCGHIGAISNSIIASAAKQSLTLDIFCSRLRCKKCGKRDVHISPPVFADLHRFPEQNGVRLT